MTSRGMPGERWESSTRIRIQGSFDPSGRSLIRSVDYSKLGDRVVSRVNPGESDNIHNIYYGDILAVMGTSYRNDFGIVTDVYGETTSNRLPVIASYQGLPSWPQDVNYEGDAKDKRRALGDYLLRGVHFAGVSGGNHYCGGSRPTPQNQGLPIDTFGACSFYLPSSGKPIMPMTPVKLALAYSHDDSGERGSPFTVEPIDPISIAEQMLRSSRLYSNILNTETAFAGIERNKKLEKSVIMREDAQIGQMFLLGIVGSALALLDAMAPKPPPSAASEAGASETSFSKAKKEIEELFKSNDTEKMKGVLKHLSESSVKTANYGDFLSNASRNGPRMVAQAVSEAMLRNHRCIGKITQEEVTSAPGPNGERKFTMVYCV